MNEIDLKTKIEGLEKAIQEHKADASRHEDELKQTNKQLTDYNKPELTPSQLDAIQEAVEDVVGHFDFDDTDNYQPEFELDYDSKVFLSSINFESYKLVEEIVAKVHSLFKETECPEDDNS